MVADPQHFMHRPLPIRLINWLGKGADLLKLPIAQLTEESLMAAARRKTGLQDWGESEKFQTPLRVMLESYQREGRLSFFGRFALCQDLIKRLSNRLLIQDELVRHPEILQEKITTPLFIVSLPRTGTTLLQRLLSQDSAYRSLLFWEALAPAPGPDQQSHATDPRIAETEKVLRIQDKIIPQFAAIHPMGATEPEECVFLLNNSLMTPSFYIAAHAPHYFEWLTGQNQSMEPVYQFYRQQLQLLQFRMPTERWLLKAPLHMYSMQALLAVFPDACIVQTHRDLTEVIPSVCSLQATIRGAFTDELDLAEIGKEVVRDMEILLERSQLARTSSNPDRFFDIRYHDLVAEPVAVVQKLYQHFGLEFTADFEKKLEQWIRANPKNKTGAHHYSLEQFGLDRNMIQKRFAKYSAQFGVA